MRLQTFILLLCAGMSQHAGAQTFTQRLQQRGTNRATVTIHQSAEIDQLVNGAQLAPARTTSATATSTPSRPSAAASATPAAPSAAASTTTTGATATEPSAAPVDNTKKIMRGVKVTGFRVQAFAGGNSRKDRQEAERIGSQIKSVFPDEPVYVHFYSPRWICRVGNYRTYEEAHQMLVSLRKQGFTQATIVKGKITVPY